MLKKNYQRRRGIYRSFEYGDTVNELVFIEDAQIVYIAKLVVNYAFFHTWKCARLAGVYNNHRDKHTQCKHLSQQFLYFSTLDLA